MLAQVSGSKTDTLLNDCREFPAASAQDAGFTAKGPGSVPGQRTKTLHAMWYGQMNIIVVTLDNHIACVHSTYP